jgi:hypothetical protein
MAQNGGARPGAGRKPGTKNPETLQKEAVLKEFRGRVMNAADVLFNAQLSLARGMSFLYKIEKELIIGPKGGESWKKLPPKRVESTIEIESYLNGEIGDTDLDDGTGATYYYITTKEPNNQAIDSMLDRVFGKSAQAITGPDGKDLRIIFDPVFNAPPRKTKDNRPE